MSKCSAESTFPLLFSTYAVLLPVSVRSSYSSGSGGMRSAYNQLTMIGLRGSLDLSRERTKRERCRRGERHNRTVPGVHWPCSVPQY